MKVVRPTQKAHIIQKSFQRFAVAQATEREHFTDHESLLSYHWDTAPPTPKQRRHAELFFSRQKPKILYSSSTFRNIPRGKVPEVAFLGRSNVGKSSLLNALMGKHLCHTSRNPGRTKTINFFAVGGEDEQGNPGRLTVLDMPGYGHKSRAEWGQEIMKYLIGRRQLLRTFVLVDALHGPKQSDVALLQALQEKAISHQIVLSKADRILFPKGRESKEILYGNANFLQTQAESIKARLDTMEVIGPKALGEILACSAVTSLEKGRYLGINNIRWAVLEAIGLNIKRRDAMALNMDIGKREDAKPATLDAGMS
ncbi:MAG: hypothetical protein LQ352_000438 [Teloschistes flavicans]|nr:MAG: hypothetical protein LQ352_000438 [Teloschistes flavicans]